MAATESRAAGRQSAIGVPTPRRDSEPKVRGTTKYAADLPVPGLLHARLLLAQDAHALITSIDTAAAEAAPGVVAVLTAKDLPIAATGPQRSREPLAREEIVYAGQPVAIVVAETEALATDALELIELDLEHLEPVLDLEAAARPGSPLARIRLEATSTTMVSRIAVVGFNAHGVVGTETIRDAGPHRRTGHRTCPPLPRRS